MPCRPSAALKAKLARVKLLLCDVDGVLTNGQVAVGGAEEVKSFNIQDGQGLVVLRREGVRVGWISSRASAATARRAEELRIDYLKQEKGAKVAVIEGLLRETGLSWSEVCYVGDDIVDLGAMKRAGVAVAVANAVQEAKALAHYVTSAKGGEGAVREVVELVLRSQKKWDRVVAAYAA